MSAPRSSSTDGLRNSAKVRETQARKKIIKALRDMQRKNMVINTNAVARHAQVARKTIYNHHDLFSKIQAAKTTTRNQLSTPRVSTDVQPDVVAALSEQLRIQKHQYEIDLATHNAAIKQLNADLAAAHEEIHRLRGTVSEQPRLDVPQVEDPGRD